MFSPQKGEAAKSRESCQGSVGINVSTGRYPYLEDHPRTCKWLISMVSKSPN